MNMVYVKTGSIHVDFAWILHERCEFVSLKVLQGTEMLWLNLQKVMEHAKSIIILHNIHHTSALQYTELTLTNSNLLSTALPSDHSNHLTAGVQRTSASFSVPQQSTVTFIGKSKDSAHFHSQSISLIFCPRYCFLLKVHHITHTLKTTLLHYLLFIDQSLLYNQVMKQTPCKSRIVFI